MKATRYLALSGIIAALYVVLTISFAPISYGAVQFRISEALTVLPFIFPPAIPGLTIGCVISNIYSPMIWDIIIGSSATLVAAVITYYMGRSKLQWMKFIAPMPAVIVNAIVVGAELTYLMAIGNTLIYNILMVGLGELVVCYVLGLPLLLGVQRVYKMGKV